MIVDVKGNAGGYVAKGAFDSVIVIDLKKTIAICLYFYITKTVIRLFQKV